ncbi:hypothetical protein [Methylobacterium terricola]|uniref:hypothetical protein n=1 Tax=Methylobacterium terricola TaxID=2583531 RepID=UPI00197C0636|nr:hypothetical protein [Methylobacterium terricola]
MLYRPNLARWFGIALLVGSSLSTVPLAYAAERSGGVATADEDGVNTTGALDQDAGRPGRSGDSLLTYCIATMQSPGARVHLRAASRRPSDCLSLFATTRQAQLAEPGQPARGGDGGSVLEAQGGRGGRSGVPADARDAEPGLPPLFERGEVRSDLIAYCTSLLQTRGRRPADPEFSGSDCAYYMLWLERNQMARGGRAGRPGSSQRAADGPDGPSIDGGVGGAGGRGGSGPGGGRGGAGGAGVSGGVGGAGGAGGSSR